MQFFCQTCMSCVYWQKHYTQFKVTCSLDLNAQF